MYYMLLNPIPLLHTLESSTYNHCSVAPRKNLLTSRSERILSGKNLTIPLISALVRPFGLCYEFLTIPTGITQTKPQNASFSSAFEFSTRIIVILEGFLTKWPGSSTLPWQNLNILIRKLGSPVGLDRIVFF